MAVYVDPAIWNWRDKMWCHMTADTLEELHEFAERLGLKRSWFQTKPGRPHHDHYDITAEKRRAAVKLGATPIDSLRGAMEHQARRRSGVTLKCDDVVSTSQLSFFSEDHREYQS